MARDDRGSRDDERSTRGGDRVRRGRDDDDNPRGTSRGGSSFKYHSRDPEKTKHRAEQGGGSNDSFLKDVVKLYKPPEGASDLRILPPTWDGAEHYGLDVHVHYGIGADKSAYLCLQKMKNKPCPVCDERKKAVAEGDTDYADELRASHRVIQYVLDRSKERDGAFAWVVGKRMDQDILRLCVDHKTGETLEIDHPENGYDLTFQRDGQGMKTRYTGMQISRRSSPLDNDKALEFVQDNPLPDQLVYFSYDHIASMFSGKAPKGKDDDDDAPPARSKARKDDDEPPARSGRDSKRDKPSYTWADVHEMKFKQLAALIDDERLDIDPDASRDDDELADQVCEALDIDEPKAERGGGRRALKDDDEPPKDERRERMREAQRGGR